jgi:uncharacterized protein (TIGR03437 family)
MFHRMHSLNPKSLRFSAVLAIAFMSLLGRIDTAQAQGQDSLTVSPTSYTFSSPFGGGFQSTTIQVGSSAAALNFTLSYQSAQNWFVAVPNGTVTPATITVNVNPGNLAPGTYTGAITLTPSGASTTPVTIPLGLVIAATNAISVSPTALTFSANVGATTMTAAQPVTVTSGTNGLAFTSTIVYGQSNTPNWLIVSPNGGNTNATVGVAANPAGLTAGTYTATITFSSGTGATGLSTQVVNVTFTVSALPTLTANVSSIPFFYQIGQSPTFDASTMLTISTGTGSSLPITLSTNTTSCPGFLGVSQTGLLTSPATVTVFANNVASYTSSQTCNGSITVTSAATTNPSITIPVTLTVSSSPLVLVTPMSASFAYQVSGLTPANQNLTISSTTSGLSFVAASNQPWLTVTPSGVTSTTSQIALSLVSSQLASLIPGTYMASVTITVSGAANSPVTIPVTLTVSANTMLTFSPAFANFVYEIGQSTPNTQSISVGTTGGQIPFVISVPTTTGAQFVTVTPACSASAPCVAPTTLTVAASPNGLSVGNYSETLDLTPSNAAQGQTPQTIPVQLSISAAGQAQLNASPLALTFTYSSGQSSSAITPQSIALTSTDPSAQLTVSNVTTNASWIITNFVPGSNLPTPQTLQVSIVPTFLTPSATPYTTNLTIATTNQQGVTSTTTVQVTLNYTSGVTLTASPASLTFAQVVSGTTPATQTVSIGASGTTGATLPFSVTASTVSGGSWLTVTPTSGTAPGQITIGVNSIAAGLSPGSYSGSVVIYGANAANPNGTLTIPVTLTVTAAPALVASPVSLTFSGFVAGANPSSQTLQITAPGAIASVTFTAAVATTSGGSWLSITGASTALGTPASIPVSVNLSGLAAGTYNGTISLTPSGGGTVLQVPVALTVQTQVTPAFTAITNAASGATGAVSPGELVSIFGTGLGPVSPAGLTLNAQGNVSTSLSGVTVSFNGTPAPLTYVSATQINCVVPYEVASLQTAQVQVSYNGVVSAATPVTIAATTPGIFTQNGSGTGLGAILLPNNSAATTANPATRGNTIIIYANGAGVTSPAGVTGAVAPSTTLLHPVAQVSVTIGGITATVSYAGSAPGLVEGVLQINAIVPTTISAGTQPIIVTVGNASSQNGVTVPVQ